jgi:uncharacterized protein (TIGR02145 family)
MFKPFKLENSSKTDWSNYGEADSWKGSGNGTNSSGFSALPGSFRKFQGAFDEDVEEYGFWWTATKYSIACIGPTLEVYNYSNSSGAVKNLGEGLSVRCVRD